MDCLHLVFQYFSLRGRFGYRTGLAIRKTRGMLGRYGILGENPLALRVDCQSSRSVFFLSQGPIPGISPTHRRKHSGRVWMHRASRAGSAGRDSGRVVPVCAPLAPSYSYVGLTVPGPGARCSQHRGSGESSLTEAPAVVFSAIRGASAPPRQRPSHAIW